MNKMLINIVTGTSILALTAGSLYASNPLDNNNNDPKHTAPTSTVKQLALPTYLNLDQGLKLACEKFPEEFENFNDLDTRLVDAFKKEYKNTCPKSRAHLATTHFDSLIPLLIRFQNFINDYQQNNPNAAEQTLDVIADINDDIDHLLKPRRTTKKPIITIPFFLDVHARFIASLGTPTEDEKSVFWHATNPEYLLGLYENDAWKTPLKALLEVKEFDNKGKQVEVKTEVMNLSYQVCNLIETMMNEKISPPIHYPMLGQNKLGIPFLVLNAIRRHYPFAYDPTKQVGAHGTDNATPAGLTAHDFVHAELDPRVKMLEKHILETVDRKYEAVSMMCEVNFDAETIAKAYAPIAIKRLLKIEENFEWFFGKLVTEVLPKRGLADFKKIMAGFFWVMREQVGFDASIFEPMSFNALIDRYVDKSIAKLNHKSSWETTLNPLKTNPLDGTSSMTEEEIIATANPNGKLENEYGRILQSSVEFVPPVEQAPLAPKYRFVDVKFKFHNGYEKTVSFTTMLHRMKNIEDARGLLNWAGLEIAGAPNLEGLTPEEATAQATAYIDGIRGKLEEVMNLFRVAFKHFASPEKDQEYANWTAEQERDLDDKMPIRDLDELKAEREQSHADALAAIAESEAESLRLLEENKAKIAAIEEDYLQFKVAQRAAIEAFEAKHVADLEAINQAYKNKVEGYSAERTLNDAYREAMQELHADLPNLSQELQALVKTGQTTGYGSPDFMIFKSSTNEFFKLITDLEALNATNTQHLAILPSLDRFNRWAENATEVALPILENAAENMFPLSNYFRTANTLNQIQFIIDKMASLYPGLLDMPSFSAIAQLKQAVENLQAIITKKLDEKKATE